MKTRKTKASQRRDIPSIHPGEVLAEVFMKPLGITQYRLAKETSRAGAPRQSDREGAAGHYC